MIGDLVLESEYFAVKAGGLERRYCMPAFNLDDFAHDAKAFPGRGREGDEAALYHEVCSSLATQVGCGVHVRGNDVGAEQAAGGGGGQVGKDALLNGSAQPFLVLRGIQRCKGEDQKFGFGWASGWCLPTGGIDVGQAAEKGKNHQ